MRRAYDHYPFIDTQTAFAIVEARKSCQRQPNWLGLQAEMVALLAWYGAGVTPRNRLGQTPRQAAIVTMSKYAKVVEVLEELEASGLM